MKRFGRSLLIFMLGLGLVIGPSRTYSQEAPLRKIQPRGLVFNTGKSSDQIRLLKDYFRQAGYENVPWGYQYDSRTKELVRDFQAKNQLKSDGIAGKHTIDLINKDIDRQGISLALLVPSTETKGDMIIINKSSNTLYHMKDGQVYKTYPVATGKSQNLSPDGRHKLVVKYKNPAWGGGRTGKPVPGGARNNPLGKRWLGLSYGGGSKYGIHGNSNENSIGTYASLGCIRMYNPDVEVLYEEVGNNTPVWIGDQDTLIKYGVNFKYN